MSPEVRGVEQARSQLQARMESRELAAQTLVNVLFVAAVGLLFALAPVDSVPVSDLVSLVLVAALLRRLEFEIATGVAAPTQLVFVPMLFVLPPAIVPLAVAAALALDRLPDVRAGRLHPQRLLTVLGDAWFAVAAAVVFAWADIQAPSLADWPVYLLALAAQLGGALACSTMLEWLAHGSASREQLDYLRQAWFADVLLAPIGLMAAYATSQQQHAYLLVLPLALLPKWFASQRQERIDHAIELSAAYRGTALLLGDVIEKDDEYTGRHSQDVVVLALAIADELRLGENERRLVEFGAMLHDIGKITTPKEILNKPAPLTEDERAVMREHTVAGQRMLDRVGGTLHDVAEVVRASHERHDGDGYPDALAGDAIPRPARIIAVSDTYSAMTTTRPYRPALAHQTALDELRDNAGTQFDPSVVHAALIVLDRGILQLSRV